MSPSTPENLGRRRFFLHRDKAVEDALERIRHGAGTEWEAVPAEDRNDLRMALAEIWTHTTRERWDQYCFSTIRRKDISRLAALGRDIMARHHLTDESRMAMEEILLACSRNGDTA